jgi:hypothetical protein
MFKTGAGFIQNLLKIPWGVSMLQNNSGTTLLKKHFEPKLGYLFICRGVSIRQNVSGLLPLDTDLWKGSV